MDEFELEDNLEFLLQSIQELMEDHENGSAFADVNQTEFFATLVNHVPENMLPDVSAEDVAGGKDMQGIPWDNIVFKREQYREMKMKNYRNYQNLSYAREDALQLAEVDCWRCRK